MTNMACPENSGVVTLNAHLNHFQSQREILEAQLVKQDQAQTEIRDFQFNLENIQRTINDLTRNQQQSNDNINDNFDQISLKYDKVLDCTGKLKQDNHDLQCGIQCKTTKKKSTTHKIKKLEMNKAKVLEEINGLREKIKNKIVISTYIINVTTIQKYISVITNDFNPKKCHQINFQPYYY